MIFSVESFNLGMITAILSAMVGWWLGRRSKK